MTEKWVRDWWLLVLVFTAIAGMLIVLGVFIME